MTRTEPREQAITALISDSEYSKVFCSEISSQMSKLRHNLSVISEFFDRFHHAKVFYLEWQMVQCNTNANYQNVYNEQ